VAADLAIIREGHIAADFYFMLAGKAKMIKLHGSPYLQERGTFHVLRLIKNGDAFGDESMSHPDSERTYSVITTEKSILLSLSSVDYVTMLLKTRDDEQAPEHIIFLSTLAFLKDFPKHKLTEEGDEYIRNYYLRAGSVISEALSESEYIYVVKYGSCRVLVEMAPQGCEFSRKICKNVALKINDLKVHSRLSLGASQTLGESNPAQEEEPILPWVPRVSSVIEFLYGHKHEIAKNPSVMTALKHMKHAYIDKDYQQTKGNTTVSILADLTSRQKFSFSNNKVRRFSEDGDDNIIDGGSLKSSMKSSGESFDFGSSSESIDVKNSTSSRQNVEKHLSFIVGNTSNTRFPKLSRSTSGARHAVGTNIDMEIDINRSVTSSSTLSSKLKSR
ncbi:cyclic nucleotide-binding domain-containing protein 2-like, partial [Elysia marginata]